MNTSLTPSTLARCIRLFQAALTELRIPFTPEQLEQWVLGIHAAMTSRSRNFHQLDHVLDVAKGLRPTQVLAALYHDVVYFQVDQGFTPAVRPKVEGALVMKDGKFFVAPDAPNVGARLVRELFDLEAGQELKLFAGLNEFLSAVVAIHDLGPLLTKVQAAAVIMCIRATIPFQGPDASGRTFPVRMAASLKSVSEREGWECPEYMVDDLVRQAVEMGNADVANFGDADLSVFLDNTWKLLPEANPALHSVGAYTLRSYRSSLEKMEGFLSQLDSGVVFHEYKGCPEEPVFQAMTRAADKNIRQGVEYLRAKLVTLALLESIAELTGGDAPIVLLAGASKEEEPTAMQIQDFLAEPQAYRVEGFQGMNELVYHVLNIGRVSATHFDSKASPLAAFLYSVVGAGALDRHFTAAKQAFSGKLPWQDFLRTFPLPLVGALFEAVATISVTRERRCLELAGRC